MLSTAVNFSCLYRKWCSSAVAACVIVISEWCQNFYQMSSYHSLIASDYIQHCSPLLFYGLRSSNEEVYMAVVIRNKCRWIANIINYTILEVFELCVSITYFRPVICHTHTHTHIYIYIYINIMNKLQWVDFWNAAYGLGCPRNYNWWSSLWIAILLISQCSCFHLIFGHPHSHI